MTALSVRITKTLILKTEAPPGTNPRAGHVVLDRDVPGLRLVVYPSGRKVWSLYYRTADGRQRRLALGDATVIHPDRARALARKLLGDVAHGEDPSEERREKRRSPAVADLADRYLCEHAEPHKKPSSVEHDRRNLRLHVLPRLGKKKVQSVTTADIEALQHSMRETPGAANRTVALLSKMFTLAERWGLRPQHSNPCTGVRRYRERRLHRDLSELELARLGQALEEDEAAGGNPVALAAIRFLLFSGLRRGEALALQWRDIDEARGFLHLRDTKTGGRVVPLNGPSLAVLARLVRLPDNAHVFTGARPGKPLHDVNRPWYRVRLRAGLDGVRLHDLRHSFASHAAAGGLGLPVIGRLLGHRVPATTARYAQLADDPARRATETVGGGIAKALAVGERAARKVRP